MVEFALALPVVLTLIFGIIEFGYLIFSYSSVNSAAREAARYGIAIGDGVVSGQRYYGCTGIINAGLRIGQFAQMEAAEFDVTYDSGHGTAVKYTDCATLAALAIDGGRSYSERRAIQGVSDTTAMTGALYLAQYDGPITTAVQDQARQAALNRAAENGYTPSEVTVVITEDSGYYLVTANINTSMAPVIAQLVYSGDFNIASKSIARIQNGSNPPPFALGQAFFAINKTACKAIDHSGNMHVNIVGSGLFSNSSCDEAIDIRGSASMALTGDLTAVGGIHIQKPGEVVVNGVVEGASQYTLPTLTEPDCTGLPPRSDGGSIMYSGYYPGGIHLSGNGSWTMEPGFYCLDGDFQLNNGELYASAVSIFQRNGGFHINGGTNYITAPQNGEAVDGAGVSWDGMAYFQAYSNTQEFILNGNADSYYQGTFFVPDAHCRLNGCGDGTGVDTQFVCDTIGFIGTSTINLIYDSTTKYVPPPPITISLVE